MRAFQIQDKRDFMKKLLMTGTFDNFQLSEASITTFASFHIDGNFHADYFETPLEHDLTAETGSLTFWRRIRPFFFELTRGKNTPLSFHIVFRLAPPAASRLLQQTGLPLSPEDIGGLFLNIRFDENGLICVSGTSLRVFTLDKSLEHAWDAALEKFLNQNQITFA